MERIAHRMANGKGFKPNLQIILVLDVARNVWHCPGLVPSLLHGLAAYFIIFVVVSFVVFSLPRLPFGITMALFMPLPIFLLSWRLFSRHGKRHGKRRDRVVCGLEAGIVWMIMAILLDILIIVFIFGVGMSFFSNASWTLVAGYLEYPAFSLLGSLAAGVKKWRWL